MAIFEDFEVKANHLKTFFILGDSREILLKIASIMQHAIFGGLKLSILSFLGTSGEIEAFYHKTENKVLSSNPTR